MGQKSTDSELMKGSEDNYKEAKLDKVDQNCGRLPQSIPDLIAGEQDYQEREKSEAEYKYWNSSDPELMISTGQTGKSELLQNSSDSQLMKSSELKCQEARAESAMKRQCLSMRSCSLPELLSERTNIWTRCNSLKSVFAANHI